MLRQILFVDNNALHTCNVAAVAVTRVVSGHTDHVESTGLLLLRAACHGTGSSAQADGVVMGLLSLPSTCALAICRFLGDSLVKLSPVEYCCFVRWLQVGCRLAVYAIVSKHYPPKKEPPKIG